MKTLTSRLLPCLAGLLFLLASISGHAQDNKKNDKNNNAKPPPAKPAPPPPAPSPKTPPKSTGDSGKGTSTGANSSGTTNKGPVSATNDSKTSKGPNPPAGSTTTSKVPLTEVKKADGAVERKTPSGQVTQRVEQKPDGVHTQHLAPGGRVERVEVRKPDGSAQTTHHDLLGREKQVDVVHADGSKESTSVRYDRTGNAYARETVQTDLKGNPVSKTVSVKNTIVINNTTVVNNTYVERNYVHGHYGFVYRPAFAIHPHVFVAWYDPYWYAPHPAFRYSWGWGDYGWYRHYHGAYWATYEVYPAPSYWVTDWMVAGYLADHYNTQLTIEQARNEAEIARREAYDARVAAEQAKEAVEIQEARQAATNAELRAKLTNDKLAAIERADARTRELAGKPNPNATPIDQETKEALKNQIEATVSQQKKFAEQSANGTTQVPPTVKIALEDPKHIYPVSKVISVSSAADSTPAGTLSEGDLLKLEPGQEADLDNLSKPDAVLLPLKMRVVTSKGEDGEVTAGTVVNVSITQLQEFDNEFRAKLDLGLAEAEKNTDAFKQSAAEK